MISVIMPIYNASAYLKRSLDSLISQTYTNFEVIMVDDGSFDDTKNILIEYQNKDERFISYTKDNGGPGSARNFGIEKAKGEYLCFLDADDYYENNFLFEMINQLENTNSDLVMCGYNIINNNSKKETILDIELKDGGLKENPFILTLFPICPWNKIFKKELFEEIKFTHLRYEDAGTIPLIYLKANKITYIKKALVNYVIDRKDSESNTRSKKIIDIVSIGERVIDYYKETNNFDFFKNELCFYILSILFDNIYKSKGMDSKFIDQLLDDSYSLLDKHFDSWRKSSYFDLISLRKALLYKHKNLYKLFLKK